MHTAISRVAQAVGAEFVTRHRRQHLAMQGAAPKAIQELAGHQDLTTTQRYMHEGGPLGSGPAALRSGRADEVGPSTPALRASARGERM